MRRARTVQSNPRIDFTVIIEPELFGFMQGRLGCSCSQELTNEQLEHFLPSIITTGRQEKAFTLLIYCLAIAKFDHKVKYEEYSCSMNVDKIKCGDQSEIGG